MSACASPTSTSCKVLLNTWNDAGCFCNGVETVDVSEYRERFGRRDVINGIAKHDSVDGFRMRASVSRANVVGFARCFKSSSVRVRSENVPDVVFRALGCGDDYKDETVSIYSVTPFIPGADKMPIGYSWPYYGISSTANNTVVMGGALSTVMDLSPMEQTASALGSMSFFLHACIS